MHELELNEDGTARMAYADREIPWHRLGTPMRGLQTAEAMLSAANADFDVVLTDVAALDGEGEVIYNPDGTTVLIRNSRATVRVNPDGSFNGLATVGTRFVVEQNKDCLMRALDIVGASKGDAVVDTVGVLREGREFFACLDLGSLIIDPNGVRDKIDRYLLVLNGHDGRTPITFANTPIRAVCKNTVTFGMRRAKSIFRAKHTRNADKAVEAARDVLSISVEWAKEFTKMAETLLRIPIPAGGRQFDTIFNTVFPDSTNATDRQQGHRDEVQMTVRGLYSSKKNAAGFGYNGWSTYNAFAEYLDHTREGDADSKAASSMNLNSWVSKRKQLAQKTILSLA
jgi:phage/plasmid-like protein (TIGR03299 family)